MAEDQYRLLPAKPLSVVLCVPGEFRPAPPFCTPSPDHALDPIRYEAKINGYCKMIEKGSDHLTNGNEKHFNYESRESSPHNTFRPCSPPQITNGHVGRTNGHSTPELNHRTTERPEAKFQAIDFSRSRPTNNDLQSQPLLYNGNDAASAIKNGSSNLGFLPNSTSTPATSSVSTIVNNLQQQRLLQNSPSASYILQTFLRSNFERAAAMQFGNGNGFGGTSVDGKPDSILASTLNDYRALQESNSMLPKEFESKKRKRKSFQKPNGLQNGGVGRVLDTSKRMRSSPTQSNIEYHYERAVEYHTMTEEEQKSHNSAHRSHWKHLLFVSQSSPNFLRTFRNAKYDEWSSEARDIFAISKPDKYKWSFLTLSKQGDVLCRRIMERVKDLKNLKNEDRPEWCPTDEVLDIAGHRAAERLAQLERILYSRAQTAQDENDKKERKLQSAHKPLGFPALASALTNAFSFPPNLISQTPEVTKPVEQSTPAVFAAIKHENISPEETC
uniref:Uncharacterized protein LOC100186892 n=1 Tax=Phallusia mammillata TaxID=59560 RepID=A0A6F9DHU2_9ASCI|nr:uncharacterized protein LOC100186892 [Phallusia mammillata]